MTTVATTAPAPSTAIAAPPAWRRLLTLARHALEASLIWLLLLAAWLAAARYLPLGHNPLIPAPDVTLRALVESLPELWTGTLSSFSILLPGFGLACLLGITSGLAVGSSPRLQRMSLPFARVAAPEGKTIANVFRLVERSPGLPSVYRFQDNGYHADTEGRKRGKFHTAACP